MSKATAICTCRKCGAQFGKVLYETGKGASRRLDEKIRWAESGGIDLCADCWKTEQRAAEQAAGLTCEIRLSSTLSLDFAVVAVFGGDAYSHRDALKAAGAQYTDNWPDSSPLWDLIGLEEPKKRWCIYGADIDTVRAKAEELGAKVTLPSSDDITMWLEIRADQQRRADEKAGKMQDELYALGPIPAWSDSVNARWPKGAKWNAKVYGKPGHYRIYLSGAEIVLTDDEAAGMRETLAAREAWRKAEAAIRAKYHGL